MLCLFDKDIRVVSVRSGYSSNYTYETEKTSLAYGGPHKLTCQLSCKAGGLQKRGALKLIAKFGVSSHHRATLFFYS